MVRRVLITCAYVCCGLVLGSFALFAIDQASGATKHQVAEIGSPSPTAPTQTQINDRHQPRKFIDGASTVLTSPFHSLIPNNSEWAQRIFELVCALTVYGLGLGYLARYAQGLP